LWVEWKYDTTTWERFADLKESNSVEVDEYATSKNIHDVSAFVWWVPHVLKKCSHIIADVTNMYYTRIHKFVHGVPKSWDDCVMLDTENGNTMWQDAVSKENKKIRGVR
jgi:hypothetical protein